MTDSNDRYLKQEASFPLVSIVAICHNHAPYVKEALEGIRNQTYPNIELIIINNLKDECESIIRQWISQFNVTCKFIQNENSKSVSQNLNLGLELSNGEYFQGFSCDDVMNKNKIIEEVERFLHLNEDFACVYSDYVKIDEHGRVKSLVKLEEVQSAISGDLINIFARSAFINAAAILLRTRIVKKLGGYNEDLIVEDYYLFTKLASNGYLFSYIRTPLVKYRILNNSSYRSRSTKFYNDLIFICESVSGTIPYHKFKNNMWRSSIIQYRRVGGRIRISHLLNYLRGTKRFPLKTIISYLFGSVIRKIFGWK